ncbi:MAG: hypothetical protein LJE89_15585 [Deltaproteobacteria bacterium]|nr:hypothetical protein [Deltaproteobacteria bacterium]
MSRLEPPDYSGIFLEPDKIRYQDIDPPLRNLIRFINSQSWIRTYGSCAGPAYHGEDAGHKHKFFIGLFVDEASAGIKQVHWWLDEANRLNGSTGLRAEIEQVDKHPFGQGMVDGWNAYRLAAKEIRRGNNPLPPRIYRRLIKCLESAWEKFLSRVREGPFM